MKYRKKPVVIEAFQYDGDLIDSKGNYYVPEWAAEAHHNGIMFYGCGLDDEGEYVEDLFIKTLEGTHHVSVGDYVIKGVKGELYPCKPDIFEETYEVCEQFEREQCMKKKRKIDFIIEDNDFEKIIFRFYPRQSNCHSFGDEPPKNWNDVYKTYYEYRILKFWKNDNGAYDGYEVLYDTCCDECSLIGEVAARLKYLSEGKKEVEVTHNLDTYTIQLLDTDIYTFADCTEWKISEGKDTYKFELFRYDDVGYRFWLEKNKAYEFGKYLEECCEYMLAHGDPI